ncbi:MAG: presenilin family intramembrane aspartyl protease [Candidatus Pacearchaeota archaeon]|nr:presenilin family intramembrane aspartyl protease [Candidatus Pacearchaeota archaeon]
MEHNIKIISILLVMFLVTQFIGIYVVNYYSYDDHKLPFGMETPKVEKETDFYKIFPSIIFAFVFAVVLLFLLNKFDAAFILRLWFFIVVLIALSISFNSVLGKFGYSIIIASVLALPLAFIKIYKRDFLIHNLTELFIYPGIAAVFVPILNMGTVILLLVLISIYDMWAVWKSGIMQKMAKYQINKLNIFGGFFVPYMSKKVKLKLKKIKESKSKNKNKKVKINLAILGGGDVIFPIIAAGVVMVRFGLIPALCVTAGATLGLSYLFFFSKKEKFYPAMPFISAGIFLGMIVGYLI